MVSFRDGTGSNPYLPNGRHLLSLLIVKIIPCNGPCISIASIAYSEQVGVNRQFFPKYGEIARW